MQSPPTKTLSAPSCFLQHSDTLRERRIARSGKKLLVWFLFRWPTRSHIIVLGDCHLARRLGCIGLGAASTSAPAPGSPNLNSRPSLSPPEPPGRNHCAADFDYYLSRSRRRDPDHILSKTKLFLASKQLSAPSSRFASFWLPLVVTVQQPALTTAIAARTTAPSTTLFKTRISCGQRFW